MTAQILILPFSSLSLLSIKAPGSPVPDLAIATGKLNSKHVRTRSITLAISRQRFSAYIWLATGQ
jgi:hypothetical protein